ncbi:MAG: archease [Acidimicrobiia bacterium]
MSYRVIAHTADTGIEASGTTIEELFVNAARGMFSLMYEPADITMEPLPVRATGATVEDLLVDWLSELLFVSESKEVAFSRFAVLDLSHGTLSGEASGVPYGSARLSGPPIKAVTYHQLELAETDEGWHARVIFDV